jgi:hypothetical protein
MSSNPLSAIASAILPTKVSDVLLDAVVPGARQAIGLAKAVGGGKAGAAGGAAPAGAAAAKAAGPSTAKATKPPAKPRPRTAARPRTSTAAAAKKPAASAGRATGYAASSASGDFAFLRDPRIPVEEKLMRFMALMAKKLDADIVDKMEQLAPGGAAKSSATKSSSGTKSSGATKPGGTKASGAGGAIGGFLGKLSGLLNDKDLKPILRQVSGPVLSAAASAMGFPAAAPFLMKAGPQIFDFAADASKRLGGSGSDGASGLASLVGGGASASGSSPSASTSSAASSKAATTSSSGALDSTDEKMRFMELQSLVDKQKEMMTLVSNMLRAIHDMHMSCIGNLR